MTRDDGREEQGAAVRDPRAGDAGAPVAGADPGRAGAGAGTMEAAARTRYLEPAELRFWRSERGTLRLNLGGRRSYPQVRLRRSFPLGGPTQMISVQDAKGEEIGLIAGLETLPDAQRRLLEEELDRAYVLPRIQRISRYREEFQLHHFEVRTDRGPRRFTVRNLGRSVRRLATGETLIRDLDGNRYRLGADDCRDRRSRRVLEDLLIR